MEHREEIVTELISMGFTREQIIPCLQAAFYNKEMAVQYLLNGIPAHITQDLIDSQ